MDRRRFGRPIRSAFPRRRSRPVPRRPRPGAMRTRCRRPGRRCDRPREMAELACVLRHSRPTATTRSPGFFPPMSGMQSSIRPDVARRCPAVDPDDHHLFVSLGCAAENLALAAATLGWRASQTVDGDRIVIALDQAPPAASALAAAIPVMAMSPARHSTANRSRPRCCASSRTPVASRTCRQSC